MEGIKLQQRDSYSAIIYPVEYKLFFNNQEDWSKQDSTVITKAWFCFKRIHIHTGHTASNQTHSSFVLYHLHKIFVFSHYHTQWSYNLTTKRFFSLSHDYICLTHLLKFTTQIFSTCSWITMFLFTFHSYIFYFQWSVTIRLECLCSLGSQFRRGAGVLDMVFETPFQLLTCGYDTFIRMWDLRLNPRYVTTIIFLRLS